MRGLIKHVVCPKCGKVKGGANPETGAEMPDPCWGKLPGIVHGCCGHGTGKGYLVFTNGVRLEFSGLIISKEEDDYVTKVYAYENTLPYNGPISVEEAEKYEGEKLEVCD